MTYAAELDEYTQQVRRGFSANTLRFWPKVPGTGNVQATSATFTLHRPGAAASDSLASGSATVTAVGAVSRLDISVDASASDTWQLDEYYRCAITWIASGVTYHDVVYFDVVTEPHVPSVSLNDLVEEDVALARILDRQASIIESTRTEEQHASVLALKAWSDVREWLRARCARDGRILPQAILDRESMRRVCVAQAIARAYKAEGTGFGTEAHSKWEEWTREAQRRFDGMGQLRYDADQSGAGDSDLSPPATMSVGRGW